MLVRRNTRFGPLIPPVQASGPPLTAIAQLLREAATHLDAGQLAEAARCYTSVLHYDPDHADALQLLGVVQAQRGELEAAVGLLRRGLAHNPAAAEGHNNLGMVLHTLKRSDEAIASYEAAIALKPGYAIALNNLGVEVAALGRNEQAIAHYQQALAIEPRYAEALNNLGAALYVTGRGEQAVEQLRAALAVRPEFIDAEINLGHALAGIGRNAAAIKHYGAALDRTPGDAILHVCFADALLKEQRHEVAMLHYSRALAIQPDLADAHASYGRALQEVGRIDEAQLSFRRAIAIDPRRPGYYLSLVRSTDMLPGDILAQLLVLSEDMESFNDDEKVSLHFALGKALADIGRPDRAFEHLLAGNALKRSFISYNEADEIGSVARTRRVFTTALMQRRRGQGVSSSLPIFIVGMPRSGSTLVEQILASHPSVLGAGEHDAFFEAIRATGLQTRNRPFPDSVPAWTDQQLHTIGDNYLRQVHALAADAQRTPPIRRITDKMLSNFRYVGLIHLVLSNARIIHTRRDPIDTCLSCFSLLFEKLAFAYDLGELGRRYSAYARLMQHWHALLPPNVILDVQYEDVVENPEAQARRIVAHCGLDWDDACLRFYEADRPVRTASVVQVRQPVYRNSVGKWRPDEATLRPLLKGLSAGNET